MIKPGQIYYHPNFNNCERYLLIVFLDKNSWEFLGIESWGNEGWQWFLEGKKDEIIALSKTIDFSKSRKEIENMFGPQLSHGSLPKAELGWQLYIPEETELVPDKSRLLRVINE